jgi:hypothetical protein
MTTTMPLQGRCIANVMYPEKICTYLYILLVLTIADGQYFAQRDKNTKEQQLEELDIYKLRLQIEGVPGQYWSTEQLEAYRDGLMAYARGDARMFSVGPMASRERAITNELNRRFMLAESKLKPEPEPEPEPEAELESVLLVKNSSKLDTYPPRKVLYGFALLGLLMGGLGLGLLIA